MKGDLEIAEKYRGITLASIAANINNALLRNHIEPNIEKILRKNQNFDNPSNSRCSSKKKKTTSRQHYYSSISPRHLNPYTQGRWSKYFSPTTYPNKSSQP